jgi:bifunctional non-homologous end joining protein LigD
MARTVARPLRTAAGRSAGRIAPQLTQLVEAAPDGDAWLHEIKFDGYRMRVPAPGTAPEARRGGESEPLDKGS